jgi:hypothetical protein
MQNRQFIFEPKMQYVLTAERGEAAVSNLQFPTCIYFTKLEPILAKISERNQPLRPAASRRVRRPASQKNFLCNS